MKESWFQQYRGIINENNALLLSGVLNITMTEPDIVIVDANVKIDESYAINSIPPRQINSLARVVVLAKNRNERKIFVLQNENSFGIHMKSFVSFNLSTISELVYLINKSINDCSILV